MSRAPRKVATQKGYGDRQRLRDYKIVFGGEEGRRVLNDMLMECRFFGQTVVNSNPVDPIQLAHADGQRNMVLHVLRMLNMKPDDVDVRKIYETMMGQFGMREQGFDQEVV